MINLFISLQEPVNTIRVVFREFTEFAVKNNFPIPTLEALLKNGSLNYCCVQYMSLLLKELFTSTENGEYPLNEILPSTKLLISHGLSLVLAHELGMDIFNQTLSSILPHIPNASFGDLEHYHFNFCNESDVLITLPDSI